MITKITVQLPKDITFHTDALKGESSMNDLKELRTIADHITCIYMAATFITQYPEFGISKALKACTGFDAVIKTYTKKRRSYWIPNLYVWEQDINPD